MPQLPHSSLRQHHAPGDPPDLLRRDARGLRSLRLPRHIAPPPPGPLAPRVDPEVALEALLRQAARQTRLSAPSDLSASIRNSLSHVSIDPHPRLHALPIPAHLVDLPHSLTETWTQARTLVHYQDLSAQQRRVALGGAGTLGFAALCMLGLALDPSEIFAMLGIVSALVLALLAIGHLLSAAVAAVLGSGLLAVAVVALYAALAALWVRLVRRPLEA